MTGKIESKAKPKRMSKKQKLIQEAKFILSPEFGCTRSICALEGRDGLEKVTEIDALILALREQTKTMQSADSGLVESTLIGQATILQQMFVKLLERAGDQDKLGNAESFYRLALKAQSQCRMTLQTLSEIKNPKAIYARQANIAHGPQQINNMRDPPPGQHPREIEKAPNELLENHDGQRLDTSKKDTAGSIDPEMETLGALDRAGEC